MSRVVFNRMKIVLTAAELDYCYHYAQRRFLMHEGCVGSYGHNAVQGNIVGIKGEVGTGKWLQKFFDSTKLTKNFETFTNFNLRGDLTVGKQQIEVKTIRPHHWRQFRMMIPPTQLSKYLQKDAIIIWATATPDDDPNVGLHGWNYASDFKKHGTPKKTICQNIWLKDLQQLRSMDDLLQKIVHD